MGVKQLHVGAARVLGANGINMQLKASGDKLLFRSHHIESFNFAPVRQIVEPDGVVEVLAHKPECAGGSHSSGRG